jgi:hypothetical protein
MSDASFPVVCVQKDGKKFDVSAPLYRVNNYIQLFWQGTILDLGKDLAKCEIRPGSKIEIRFREPAVALNANVPSRAPVDSETVMVRKIQTSLESGADWSEEECRGPSVSRVTTSVCFL